MTQSLFVERRIGDRAGIFLGNELRVKPSMIGLGDQVLTADGDVGRVLKIDFRTIQVGRTACAPREIPLSDLFIGLDQFDHLLFNS